MFQFFVFSDETSCPVMLFKLYLNKLHPDINSLWQKPREGQIHYLEEAWFEKRNVGKDMLERFMKISLAKCVKLDGDYTNHSIRSTVISTLDAAGFEGRHIIKLSSHKSESTIKDYSRKCPDNKRKEMFDSLNQALGHKHRKIENKSPAATVSVPLPTNEIQINDIKENLPNFNIVPFDDFQTIDDAELANIILDAEQLTGTSPQTTKQTDAQLVPTNTVPQLPASTTSNFQTTLNTINNNPIPRVPYMYFPHSNVTINYNFPK